MAVPPPVALSDQLAVFERDIRSTFHRLETRIQDLGSKNHGLENRVHALEMENLALKRVTRRSTISDSMDVEDREPVDQMAEGRPEDLINPAHLYEERYSEEHESDYEEIAEDLSPAGDLSAEHEIDESPEPASPPTRPHNTHSPTTVPPNTNYTVWYESGTLHTNAPAHLLTTSSWTSLITAFTTTSTFLATKNRHWHSIAHPTNCVRGVVQRGASVWTEDSPGEYCCKRCFNTQRVCLKYNLESGRLEALPLPEEVRAEGEEFGLGWFVAEEVNLSTNSDYKGVW
jgi:hypothetical protein